MRPAVKLQFVPLRLTLLYLILGSNYRGLGRKGPTSRLYPVPSEARRRHRGGNLDRPVEARPLRRGHYLCVAQVVHLFSSCRCLTGAQSRETRRGVARVVSVELLSGRVVWGGRGHRGGCAINFPGLPEIPPSVPRR